MRTRQDLRLVVVLLAISLLGLGAGCSISKSISSPFKSSSNSSNSSGGDDSNYKQEVQDFAFAYGNSGGEVAAFQRGIGALAQREGITNWESDKDTVKAIGKGFRKSGMGDGQMRNFGAQLFTPGSKQLDWLEDGFDD